MKGIFSLQLPTSHKRAASGSDALPVNVCLKRRGAGSKSWITASISGAKWFKFPTCKNDDAPFVDLLSFKPCGICGLPQHSPSVPHLPFSLVDKDPYFTSPTQPVHKQNSLRQYYERNAVSSNRYVDILPQNDVQLSKKNSFPHTFENIVYIVDLLFH